MARRLSKNVSPQKGDRGGFSSQQSDAPKADVFVRRGCGLRRFRRLAGLPMFAAALLFGSFWQGEVLAQRTAPHTFNRTSIADLNSVLALEAQAQDNGFTLQANDIVNFIMTVDMPRTSPYIIESNEAMTGTAATLTYALNSYKRGGGLWRLGEVTDADGTTINNASNLWAQGQNYFTVQAGTLELMQGSSITLQGAAAMTKFELAGGTVLNSRGGNAAGNSFINAASIVLGNNVSIGLDVSNARIGSPILTLTGTTSLSDPANTGNVNLLGFTNQTTPLAVQLLQYTYAAAAPAAGEVPTFAAPLLRFEDYYTGTDPVKQAEYGQNYSLLVRGELWDDVVRESGRLAGTLEPTSATTPAATGGTVTYYLNNFTSQVGLVSWNSTATSAVWDATSHNWQGTGTIAGSTTFLHGDAARFSVTGNLFNTITVQAGGVQITDNGSYGYGMLVDGGNYTFTNDSGLIGIDGSGKVVIRTANAQNRAAVTFSSANSYWGGTEVDAATFTLGSSGAVGTGALTLANGAILNFSTNLAVDIFYNNISVGTSDVQIFKKTGNDLTLEGDVIGTGDTIVEVGTLRKNITTGVLTVNDGATYHMLGYNDDPANFTTGSADHNAAIIARRYYNPRTVTGLQDGDLGGGTVNLDSHTLVIDAGVPAAGEYVFSGLITGIAQLTGPNWETTGSRIIKRGVGTQVFAFDQNEYRTGTIVSQGTLVGRYALTADIANYRPFGYGDVSIEEGAVLAFDLTGQNDVNGEPQFVAGMSNKITGEGEVHVGYSLPNVALPTNVQILHLSSTDSDYTGITKVLAGKLRVSNVNSTGKTSEVSLGTGTTALQFIDMTDSSVNNPYDRVITGAGNVEVLTATGNIATRVYLRSYNEDAGAGIPSASSSYTGYTRVENGSILEDTELHLLDVLATGETGRVQLDGPYSTLYLDFASMQDEDGNEIEQVYDRFITGDGNLVKDLAGTAVLEMDSANPRDNDYTGYTLVTDGVLKLNYADATGLSRSLGGGDVTVGSDGMLELAFDGIYDKNIDGMGIVAKSGEGTTTQLGGFSTYTGGTYIYSGTLSYNNLDPLVAGNLSSSDVTFLDGGGTLQNRSEVLDFAQSVYIHAGSTATFDTQDDLVITAGARIEHIDPDGTGEASHLVKTGAATMTVNAVAAWTGSTRVEEGVLKNNIPNDTALAVLTGAEYHTGYANRRVSALSGGGIVLAESGDYFFEVSNTGTNVFEGRIIGDGNLVKSNSGTLELTGANSYEGWTRVEGGVLVGNIALGTDLTVWSGATYKAGGSNRNVGSLQGSGTVDMENNSLTIHMTDGGVYDYQGVIQNGNWLTKSGTGTQIFSGLKYDFAENVEIQGGNLTIGGSPNVTSYFNVLGDLSIRQAGTLGIERNGKVDVGGTFNVEGTLKISLGNNLVTTKNAFIGKDAVLEVSGIASTDQQVTIVRSENVIDGKFEDENVHVDGQASGFEFLDLGAGKSEDGKEIYVGMTLAWYRTEDAHGTFHMTDPDTPFTVGITLKDVPGNVGWDGKTLTKTGPGTLILSVENTYTGETIVEEGTLKLTNEQATGGSSGINLVGASTVLEIDFKNVDPDGVWSKGLTTPIAGDGGLYKTGTSVAVLGGKHTFTGDTVVQEGVLLLDGTSQSRTWVRAGAYFGGDGTLNNKLTLQDNSYYYWRFDGTVAGSDTLTVGGGVHIDDGVIFRPVPTVAEDQLGNFEGLVVINSRLGVSGEFASIDAGANPFYRYELDYSDTQVKISAFLRDTPLALSDIVAASLNSAQTRMYRTAFQQITREWMSDSSYHSQTRTVPARGQGPVTMRTAWMNFIGRGGDMDSSYFSDDFSFQSYGVQAGLSLVSDSNRSAGILFGREENKLSNDFDRVKGEDHYLGFYYGRVFADYYDVKAYIGGGWQKNRLLRTSNGYRYAAKYDGNTYNTNIEIGRHFIGQREWIIRPFVGADLNVTWNGAATENSLDLANSNEYRSYGRSDLTQFFLRFGVDTTKTWRRIDFRAGTQIRWNLGDTRAKTKVYYPALLGKGVTDSVYGHGCDLGRFEWGINLGLNWFLTERRNTLFFLDYDADIFLDRDGDPTEGTGTVGFVWRF